MSITDLRTVTLWRDGSDHYARTAELGRGSAMFGPADSAGDALELVGQHFDRRDTERLVAEARAQDGAPAPEPVEEVADLEDVARVVEVLEDHAGEALRLDRLHTLTGLGEVELGVALAQAKRDGVVQAVPFGDRTFWTLSR